MNEETTNPITPILTRELVEQKFPNLKNLEATHGTLTVIRSKDKIGLFKKPSREVLRMVSDLKETNPIGFSEQIGNNCFVDGDRELLEKDEHFIPIMPLLAELVEYGTAELLKL